MMNLSEIVNIANRLQREALIFFAIIGIIILVCFEIFFKSELNLLSLIVLILSILFVLCGITLNLHFFGREDLGHVLNIYVIINCLAIFILILASLIFILITNNIGNLVRNLVDFFNVSQNIVNSTSNFIQTKDFSNLFDLSRVVVIISIFFIYCSIFIYIKKKTIYVFLDSDDESKIISFIYESIVPVFNYILIPCALFYYIFLKFDLIQVLIILDAYTFLMFIVLPLLSFTSRIAHDYPSLEKINRTMNNSSSSYRSILSGITYFAQIAIFILSLLLIFEMMTTYYNLITVMYLVLVIIVWFHVISVLNAIPSKKVSFTFVDGSTEPNAYIVEETEFGDYVILPMPDVISQQKTTKTLVRNAISAIEEIG